MKRGLALLLIFILTLGLTACKSDEAGNGTEDEMVGYMVLVTEDGVLGDESFHDVAWEGFQRAEEELGVRINFIGSKNTGEYESNITKAIQSGAELIVCVGTQFAEVAAEVAKANPQQRFAILDSDSIDAPNVSCLAFNEEEGSFLAGVAAALMTKTNQVGFVGGVEVPLIKKFQYGYEAGVRAVNPKIKILVDYAGTFEDAAKGKALAQKQHGQDADVIYHASGGCGIGVIEAADEENFWVIGVDQDQSSLAPEHVLCSMTKRADNAAYIAIKEVVDGTFNGGIHVFTLADEGVGISDDAGNLPAEVKEAISRWSEAIVNGEFEVPYTKETLEQFKAPKL